MGVFDAGGCRRLRRSYDPIDLTGLTSVRPAAASAKRGGAAGLEGLAVEGDFFGGEGVAGGGSGRTLWSINFDILVKSIFLFDERFTNSMTTKLEQRGMTTNLM